MDSTTILYVLSTMAQTCAALTALVGALGLYRLQSIRSRQAASLAEIRQLLTGIEGSVEWALSTPTHQIVELTHQMANQPKTENAKQIAPRMKEYMTEWDRFDPDHRRASKLLGLFVLWNLLAIGISLGAFAFVHRLAGSPLAVVGLWVLTVGTVLATAMMLLEMRDSFGAGSSAACSRIARASRKPRPP